MNLLATHNLHLWRGDLHVLRGVHFELRSGECLQVIGANGRGKTSLLRGLALLTPFEEGQVLWDGRDAMRERAAYQVSVSYLGHDHGLKGDMTALENLRFAAAIKGGADETRIVEALVTVGFGTDLQSIVPVRHMSAGQRRRLALARVQLSGCPLWLMDEPGSNLDTAGQGIVHSMLQRHLQGGGLAVVATHQDLTSHVHNLRTCELE